MFSFISKEKYKTLITIIKYSLNLTKAYLLGYFKSQFFSCGNQLKKLQCKSIFSSVCLSLIIYSASLKEQIV